MADRGDGATGRQSVRAARTSARRRRHEPQQRARRIEIRLSPQEYERVAANAAEDGSAVAAYVAKVATLPRAWLIETAARNAPERSRARAEAKRGQLQALLGMQRQLRGACTNLNQAVAKLNALGEEPGELRVSAEWVRKVATRVDEVIAEVVRG